MKTEAVGSTDRTESQALIALNKAALSISQDLDLDETLQQIVDSARELADADYAAVGVFGRSGQIEVFVTSGMAQEAVAEIEHPPVGRGLLGALLDDTQAIRVRDVAEDPRATGFPPGHPEMTSFLGVPVAAGSERYGNLYLTDKQGAGEFDEADEELLTVFAAHAAVAIKNARRYEKVGRVAIVEERSRIGMDLHDGVIQSIYAVGLMLETALLTVEDKPAEAARMIHQSIDGLNEAIGDIRNFILDLRPRRFEGDLSSGIDRLVREFRANTLVEMDVSVPDKLPNSLAFPPSQAIFLTAQEALANIARHARASHVTLDLRAETDRMQLTVADDGRGFDPAAMNQALGHGLANMRARAEELEGTFKVASSPGAGTTILLELPLD